MPKRLAFLIFNQSYIDFSCNLIGIAFWMLDTQRNEIKNQATSFGWFICQFFTVYIQWSYIYNSKNSLILCTVEQHLAICNPIRHRNFMTKRKLWIFVAMTHILGFLEVSTKNKLQFYVVLKSVFMYVKSLSHA